MKTIHTLIGKVRRSKNDGRKTGHPTASINVDKSIADGIYLGYAQIARKRLPSFIYVGTAVTLAAIGRQAEVYILDFEGDLHNSEIRLELLEKIREHRQFASIEEMVRQIQEDEKIARIYLRI